MSQQACHHASSAFTFESNIKLKLVICTGRSKLCVWASEWQQKAPGRGTCLLQPNANVTLLQAIWLLFTVNLSCPVHSAALTTQCSMTSALTLIMFCKVASNLGFKTYKLIANAFSEHGLLWSQKRTIRREILAGLEDIWSTTKSFGVGRPRRRGPVCAHWWYPMEAGVVKTSSACIQETMLEIIYWRYFMSVKLH